MPALKCPFCANRIDTRKGCRRESRTFFPWYFCKRCGRDVTDLKWEQLFERVRKELR